MKKINVNEIEPTTEIEIPVDTCQEVTGCTLIEDPIDVDTHCNESSVQYTADSNKGSANEFVQGTCRTPPRTIFEPRYVGDIRSPHLATPRRAKRTVALARGVIDKQKKNN
ncbi:uncharacterized protein [Linepithema humile]|uniref:uncharacterized protein n=1 Tax=Linepithema humile TaxID=83485 RepID=UPI0006235CC5|nr:PREDICTED: uncharacterized protein LOC105678003 [Linepithema humile]